MHYTVIASIGVLAAHLLHISDRDAARVSSTWLLVTLLGALVSLLAADLTYRFIEAPSHRMARRLAATTTG